jgi:hypothetical protein
MRSNGAGGERSEGGVRQSPSSAARGGRLLRCLLLTALCFTSGCATGRINLWPLYFDENRMAPTPDGPRLIRTTEVLYPIFSREAKEGGSWYAVRPLYNYDYNATRGEDRVQYLWPLGLYFKHGDYEWHLRLFPLFAHIRVWQPSMQGYSSQGHLIELIRWGDHARLGPYFAIFPLAGVTHDVIGDTWSFVLFPLYSHYRQGNYVRDDVLWPVMSYGRTSGNYAGAPQGARKVLRFWPFYAYQRSESRMQMIERHDALWPLVRWGRRDRGGKHYFTVLAVTPFYSAVEMRDGSGKVVNARRSVLGVSYGKVGSGEAEVSGWSALWSFFKGSQSNTTDEVRFMPFYWQRNYYTDKKKEPERRWQRRWMPWPIVHTDADRRDPEHYKGGFVVAPVYWQYTDAYYEKGRPPRVGRSITLFPLWTWKRDPEGGHHFWMLSHGWEDTTQGFKRNYGAFFDIFQYHHTAQEAEVRLVDRLYHQRTTARGTYVSLASVFTYDSTGEVVGQEGSYVSFLFDLVKYSWSEKGSRWRIFYIPL